MPEQIFAEFLPDTSPRILGDTFYIGLKNIRNAENTDISDNIDSGTVTIYDSSGSTTLASNSLLLTGDRFMMGTFRLTTGAGKIITAAGTYRADYQISNTDTLESWGFQEYIVIKARPF